MKIIQFFIISCFFLQAQCPPDPRPGRTLNMLHWRSTRRTCSWPRTPLPDPTGLTRRAFPWCRSTARRRPSGSTATRSMTITSRSTTTSTVSTTRRRRLLRGTIITTFTTGRNRIGGGRRSGRRRAGMANVVFDQNLSSLILRLI